ncbi:MAG: AAA family ATPase [Methylovulum sp.]|nr:AAA family ATPase [Methylovulum sp.]
MEAIIFIGIQASGKSTFYKEHFFNSHLRISNDLLKTKHRAAALMEYCLATQMPLVLDNTHVSQAVRAQCITTFKQRQWRVLGYYFKTDLQRSLVWNRQRQGKAVIPEKGILGTYKRLELPTLAEGFDQLFYVDFVGNQLVAKAWRDEI